MAVQSQNAVRWVYEQHNKWVDYDDETTQHIEEQLQHAILTKTRKLMLIVKLHKGPFFGLEKNKNKYKIVIYLHNILYPCIERSVQTETRQRSKQMIGVTRFPSLDFHRSVQDVFVITNYKCKYKWYLPLEQKDDIDQQQSGGDLKRPEYDPITSTVIELAYNAEKLSVVLNTGTFSTAKRKNLFSIKFNHHSIPPQLTQQQHVSLNEIEETELKYEQIESKQQETSNVAIDDIMAMILAIKQYMRPLSMRYWTHKRIFSPNDPLKCIICYGEFEDINFLEYWIHRKMQNKASEETAVISSKRIAIQLSRCAGEHFFHSECVARYVAPKRKCPLCAVQYGVAIGCQPPGTMQVRMHKKSDCASKGTENKGKGSIEIVHKFAPGLQSRGHQSPGRPYPSRIEYMYLPKTWEGMECLGLIRVAWKRKLLYTVGRSVTRNADNLIIWTGIHFKTSRHGGFANHGWPDKTYFARVRDEFKAMGITVDDIEDRYKRKVKRRK